MTLLPVLPTVLITLGLGNRRMEKTAGVNAMMREKLSSKQNTVNVPLVQSEAVYSTSLRASVRTSVELEIVQCSAAMQRETVVSAATLL